MMKATTINIINIGLMGGCLALSFWSPFLFFLLCFALLSPLHYFSEISWLHQRQYFSPKKYDWVVLAVLGLLVFSFQFIFTSVSYTIASVVAFGFLISLVMVATAKNSYRLFGALVAVGLILAFSHMHWYAMLFAIFMTTIVHTFIFTGAFMLKGALQRKSASGIMALVCFIVCVSLCFLVTPSSGLEQLSPYILESYSYFWVVNTSIMRMLGYTVNGIPDLYQSTGAIMVMRFIAFVYSYHFMNWFSKTSLIGWHKGGKKAWAFILLAWGSCVGFFFYDYKIGISVIYFFSMMHVFLEFPLNHQTFISIAKFLNPQEVTAAQEVA